MCGVLWPFIFINKLFCTSTALICKFEVLAPAKLYFFCYFTLNFLLNYKYFNLICKYFTH